MKHRVLIFLLIQILQIVSEDTQCTRTKLCITEKDATVQCAGTIDSGKCDLTRGNCCPRGEYCYNKSCIITNFKNKDKIYCKDINDCFPDQLGTRMYDCVNNRCTSLFNRLDNCDNYDSCYGHMPCLNEFCVGFNFNDTCMPPIYNSAIRDYVGFSCKEGLYCSNQTHTCQYLKKDKESCNFTYECMAGSSCNLVRNICTPLFSLQPGQDCSANHFCDIQSVCVNKKCTQGEIRKIPTLCRQDNDCVNRDTCGPCNEFNGRRYCIHNFSLPATNCKEEEKTLLDCYVEFNCSTYFSYILGSCQHDNCLSYMQSVWYCKMCLPNEDELGNCYGRLDVFGTCLIPLPFFVVIIVIGGLFVILMILFFLIIKIGDACNTHEDYQRIN